MKRILSALAAPVLLVAGCATTEPAAVAAPKQPQKARAAAVAPAFAPADFMGRTAEDIDRMLGPAGLVRREGEGEFRRYALDDCMLVVILYPDETGRSAARRLDAVAKVTGDPAPELSQCLAKGLSRAG